MTKDLIYRKNLNNCSSQRVSEFVKGNGNKLTIGQYEISELEDGSFYIEHESGEGTQVSKDDLEACITQFYADYF